MNRARLQFMSKAVATGIAKRFAAFRNRKVINAPQ
jgi:hypothetical protein